MDESPRVTVLGTGAIGYGMVVSLLRAGLDTTAWNRTRAKAEPLAELGATVADDPAEAVKGADVVVTALFDALVGIPRVLQVFHVAGVDDFLVHVAVQDATALRDIVLEHITVHPVVRGTETQLVFELRDGRGLLAR